MSERTLPLGAERAARVNRASSEVIRHFLIDGEQRPDQWALHTFTAEDTLRRVDGRTVITSGGIDYPLPNSVLGSGDESQVHEHCEAFGKLSVALRASLIVHRTRPVFSLVADASLSPEQRWMRYGWAFMRFEDDDTLHRHGVHTFVEKSDGYMVELPDGLLESISSHWQVTRNSPDDALGVARLARDGIERRMKQVTEQILRLPTDDVFADVRLRAGEMSHRLAVIASGKADPDHGRDFGAMKELGLLIWNAEATQGHRAQEAARLRRELGEWAEHLHRVNADIAAMEDTEGHRG